MACYENAVEKNFNKKCKNEQAYFKGYNKRKSLHRLATDSQMSIDLCSCIKGIGDTSENFHYCPANPKFVPSLSCQDHLECNDPVFKCFDLAKIARMYAEHIPEYKPEYEEIADQCQKFSVQLLDECANTEEVKVLLEEPAGSTKYFRFANEIKYPRLRLAIELNHKEFVGHMFCQQVLREQWHGDVLWPGSPFVFKLLHFLLQVLLAPITVILYCLYYFGRYFKITSKMEWMNTIVNLDIPLNRFLIFTGYYLIYVGVVMLTIQNKMEEMKHPQDALHK